MAPGLKSSIMGAGASILPVTLGLPGTSEELGVSRESLNSWSQVGPWQMSPGQDRETWNGGFRVCLLWLKETLVPLNLSACCSTFRADEKPIFQPPAPAKSSCHKVGGFVSQQNSSNINHFNQSRGFATLSPPHPCHVAQCN